MQTKAVTPEDIKSGHTHALPNFVVEAFNHLITKNFSNGRSRFTQDVAINEIQLRMGIRREDIFTSGFLNVESFYRANGWLVEYDKPGYCEDYQASFTFTAK